MAFKVRLLVSYDGTDYCGWQDQVIHKNKNSIQGLLQKALSKIYKVDITCTASGRTDAGVHASGQNVNFRIQQDPRGKPLIQALRTLLPRSICVRKAWIIPNEFCVLKSAVCKEYKYFILNDEIPSALLHRYSYWCSKKINFELLQEMSTLLVGQHDFKAFQSAGGTDLRNTTRTIYKAEWFKIKKNLIGFRIVGDGFLKQMVRNIVSTQIDLVSEGKETREFKELILMKDRRLLGKPAPPQGLFLSKVYYPRELQNRSIPFV